jgi:hypothetical protein
MAQTLHLDATSNDDAGFLELVGRYVTTCVRLSGLTDVTVVHVDNWFGDRWLGFRGKILGSAGVWARMGESKARLAVPPFHPHRILSERRFELRDDNTLAGPFPPARRLHEWRSSEENTRLTVENVAGPGVFAWFSGNTRVTRRGSLMVYVLSVEGASGWYGAFEQAGTWRVKRRIGISDTEWRAIANPQGLSRD